MNEDRLKGAAANLGGQVKDAVGGIVDNDTMQAKGKVNQVAGQVQQSYDVAKASVRDAAGAAGSQIEDFVHERPLLAVLSAAAVGFVLSRLIQR